LLLLHKQDFADVQQSRTGSLASSTATVGLSKSTMSKTQKQAHTPASIARLINGQKAPAGPINSIIKSQQRKAEVSEMVRGQAQG
jgi:hypothetical protein